MKIKAHTIYSMLSDKPPHELTLDNTVTIRELLNHLKDITQTSLDNTTIRNIEDKNGQSLCNIYANDPLDENLLIFIRKQIGNMVCDLSEIKVLAMNNPAPGYNRPTERNPNGYDRHFFQDTRDQSYSARFRNLGINNSDLPDEFFDPITTQVMDNPVIASDLHTYDASTLRNLNFISPYTHLPLEQTTEPDQSLRARMERFLSEKESSFSLK